MSPCFFGVPIVVNAGFMYFKISAALKRRRRNGRERKGCVKILERLSIQEIIETAWRALSSSIYDNGLVSLLLLQGSYF